MFVSFPLIIMNKEVLSVSQNIDNAFNKLFEFAFVLNFKILVFPYDRAHLKQQLRVRIDVVLQSDLDS